MQNKYNCTFLSVTITIMVFSSTHTASNNPEKWDKEELTKWFWDGKWRCGWLVVPDKSVNQREFAVQFFKNREQWEKAFRFLATADLKAICPGRHELEGSSLFVNVDEYTTRDEEVTRFEAHRKYADIQYLVFGEEQIGLTALENTTETTLYDSAKDIVFLTAGQGGYRLASPEHFFLFFPGDAHRPCVKTGENMKVRKVVVKVLIE